MTDKKFTDEEIIKSLECCSNLRDCCECSYFHDKPCIQLKLDALNLINRQKAREQTITEQFNSLGQEYEALYRENVTQKEEIERLKEPISLTMNCDITEDVLEFLKKHKTINVYDNGAVRAEAVKEFAERLKAKEAVHFCKCGQPFVYTDLFNGEIDNLVKEMVGEPNETE